MTSDATRTHKSGRTYARLSSAACRDARQLADLLGLDVAAAIEVALHRALKLELEDGR